MIVAAARIERRVRRNAKEASHVHAGASAQRVSAYVARLESGRFLRDTLDDAARACAISRRRFTELFRTRVGETWLKRVQRLRIEHARRLLRDTDKSIAAVAFESGFDDASHFHRVFKSIVKCTPMEERACANRRTR